MASLLLTDTTMPVNFCKAGIGCARAMADHLGERVHCVTEVHAELERQSQKLSALATLLESWPSTPIRELDLDLKAEVAAAIKARLAPGQHPDEDRGEIATVLYAASRREASEVFSIVTDDGFGKRLGRDRGFTIMTTADLTLEMVKSGTLSHTNGERVWRQCVRRRRWSEFGTALAQRASH